MAASSLKLFGTDGIRGRVGVAPMTEAFCERIGRAVSIWLKSPNALILIGRDTRASGRLFELALSTALQQAGHTVECVGLMPTPAIAFLTRQGDAQLGIAITASHNPYTDNGLKFFSAEGLKLSESAESELEVLIQNQQRPDRHESKPGRSMAEPSQLYETECLRCVERNFTTLKNIRVAVDCANGAMYRVAPAVLNQVCSVVDQIGVDPDGRNINLACGSMALGILRERVLKKRADVGIAFDGDGDRVVMLDSQGCPIDGDQLLFILSTHCNESFGGVVGTTMSNFGLEKALRRLGIPFARADVGDRNVFQKMRKLGWRFGGETSGHIIDTKLSTTGDGLKTALRVLQIMADTEESLSELASSLELLPQIQDTLALDEPNAFLAREDVRRLIESAQHGLGSSGRLLVRASGTEPVLRIMVEGADSSLIDECKTSLLTQLGRLV